MIVYFIHCLIQTHSSLEFFNYHRAILNELDQTLLSFSIFGQLSSSGRRHPGKPGLAKPASAERTSLTSTRIHQIRYCSHFNPPLDQTVCCDGQDWTLVHLCHCVNRTNHQLLNQRNDNLGFTSLYGLIIADGRTFS